MMARPNTHGEHAAGLQEVPRAHGEGDCDGNEATSADV